MRKKLERRGNWYLLTGLILGVMFGLVYAWVVNPVEYVDAGPSTLREDFKDQYRLLVAIAYQADNNFARAKVRLDQLKDPDIASSIAMQAQRFLADGHPESETRALGLLAVALGEGPTPIVTLPSATVAPSPTASVTPTAVLSDPTLTLEAVIAEKTSVPRTIDPTTTALPTRTQTATPGAPFLIDEQTLVCNPSLNTPLIQVLVYDSTGQEVSGVEVIVNWDGSEEHFFTGLKPELGAGYADFSMTVGENYILRLADGGQPVSDLTPAECEGDGGMRYYGSWLLVFRANGR
jgi:hypothetical protein